VKIGVLSDSHVSSFDQLNDKILAALADVDLIVHAGDFVAKNVLDGLKQMGKVKAVRGNMDSDEIKEILPEKELLELEGRKIGIIHGWGSPYGIDERVGNAFSGVDIIIYGHSHYPQNEMKNGVFFFNPGPARSSFGILTIGTEVSEEIIRL
jgi:putative phosphoesterase